MLKTIKAYLKLRRLGIRDAWEISGMSDVCDSLVGYTCLVVCLAMAVYFAIDYKSEYTQNLEKALALCVSEEYKPIKIGDEWFLCGVNKLGEF